MSFPNSSAINIRIDTLSHRIWLNTLWFTALVLGSILASIGCSQDNEAKASSKVFELIEQYRSAISKGDESKAVKLLEELCLLDDSPSDDYDLACLYCNAGRHDEAIGKLRDGIANSHNDPTTQLGQLLREDKDLAPLRDRPDFESLIQLADQRSWKPKALAYETGEISPIPFVFGDDSNDYLNSLRNRYKLEVLIAGARSDMDRVRILCTWVHTRWSHVGDITGQPQDPISILEAAEKGGNFRCVEYGITATGVLNAVGIPARVVSARAADVETRRFGAGHVFAEAWLRDQNLWVFVDPQLNVVGEVDGKPLNTVEFQRAISDPEPSILYPKVLGSCFYYFSFNVDTSYPIDKRQDGRVDLAPVGAPFPEMFQRKPMAKAKYKTRNLGDVYGPPSKHIHYIVEPQKADR